MRASPPPRCRECRACALTSYDPPAAVECAACRVPRPLAPTRPHLLFRQLHAARDGRLLAHRRAALAPRTLQRARAPAEQLAGGRAVGAAHLCARIERHVEQALGSAQATGSALM